MPRFTKKMVYIKECQQIVKERLFMSSVRFLFDEEDDIEDDIDEALMINLQLIESERYLFRTGYRKWTSDWKTMLNDSVYMNDTEFLANFRMDRHCFNQLTTLLKKDKVFTNYDKKMEKRDPVLQIMVFLKYLGSYGNSASALMIGRAMGISKGAVLDYVYRTATAICNLRQHVIKWPNEQGRKEISQRIQEDFDFPNCVGLIDGTLFPLAFKPKLNGEDYFTRKGGYSVNGLVICDDQARITWFGMGWPGSVHDNRVWSNSEIFLNKQQYFTCKEYLLGDSAFSTSSIMVPAYKKGPNGVISEDKSYFNTMLAKIRIKSEHCIGLLKGRFQRLREHRRVIEEKSDYDFILNITMSACVLHNLLINNTIPEWYVYDDDSFEDDDDELNLSVEDEAADTRRNQVFAYMLEQR
jgi:DDE superfamily endonuclease